MSDKTFAYYRESFGGQFLGFISAILSIFYTTPRLNITWESIITQEVNISIGSFGFLLTIFAIIIQADNENIKLVRARSYFYARFLNFNKRIIILSFIICIISAFIISMKGAFFYHNVIFVKSVKTIVPFFTVWFFIDIIIFLKLVFGIFIPKIPKERI